MSPSDRHARHLLGAKRDQAEQYLLITIAAFAATVAATRWYLDLSGYPTIGGGELHVAHVLWGGLLLVIAVLLPMLFVGRRATLLSALLAGIGVGLFIDEVGKFLTTSNDYFYAPAAPIIYGGILLLVLVWVLIRRIGAETPFDATHSLIEALRDGVDGNLTRERRDRVVEQFRRVAPDSDMKAPSIGEQLVATLESPAAEAQLGAPGPIASGKARELLERLLPTRIERWLVIIGLVWSTLQAFVAVIVLLAWDQVIVGGLQLAADAESRLEYPSEPAWVLLMLAISVVVGVGSAAAIGLLGVGRRQAAMRVAAIAVLVGLVAGDLVEFYAFQIGALASTVIDLLLLGLVLDYRIRLKHAAEAEPVGVDGDTD